MKRSQRLGIGISFFGVLMLLSLFLTHSYLSLAALTAAALHECAHVLAARALGVSLGRLRLDIFGASLSLKGDLPSYKREAAVALAGPLFNLLSAALLLLFPVSHSGFLSLFVSASLFLGLLNLLPIKDLDGGRVLFCLLAPLLPLNAAGRIVRLLSFCTILSLWMLSVYLLLRLGASLSLFVFSAALFCKCFLKRGESA